MKNMVKTMFFLCDIIATKEKGVFMGKIVAIGGGEIINNETKKIDKYIVSLSGKERPKLLFIPTASGDDEKYIKIIEEYFSKLNCRVTALCLLNNEYTSEELKNIILNTDIIYVGGGDTVFMMNKWKEFYIDKYLKEAYKQNIILSGLSAGSICWFKYGYNNPNKETNDNGWWDLERSYGINLIPMINCVHYNQKHGNLFDEFMIYKNLSGIALEDGTALVEIDGKYSIIRENKKYKAYIFKNICDKLIKNEIVDNMEIFI